MVLSRVNPYFLFFFFFSALFLFAEEEPHTVLPLISPNESVEQAALKPLEEISSLPEIEDTEEIASFLLQAATLPEKEKSSEKKEGYTINYNTVSIVEYIRFASKICSTNFIFDEAELNFTVSVVSDAPITKQNVMATLIQVLRIHGMTLLEQGNSLVIHKAEGVNQIAKLVTEPGQEGNSSIVTRIFRLKNAKVDSVAAVIQPMISVSSILESSPETRQLILTDITANVEKVASLIEVLDSPYTPLEIKTFETTHNSPEFLIELASQIMNPITQGTPFILVPQSLANQIFVVSTPELIQQTMKVLHNLDTPPKKNILSDRRLRGENILVYKVENTTGSNVLMGLQAIAENLSKSGLPEGDLISAIEGGKWISNTNSLMFVGSQESLTKIHEFLLSLDVASAGGVGKGNFFVYRPIYKSSQEIEKAILEMSENLKKTKGADATLITTIESVKINPSTHTLVFSGDESTFPRVRELLSTIDVGGEDSEFGRGRKTFFLYQPQYASKQKTTSYLKQLSANLNKKGEESLLETISSMKWIDPSQSFMFYGTDESNRRLEALLKDFDTPASAKALHKNFLIYPLQFATEKRMNQYLEQITANLKKNDGDPGLIEAIESRKWIENSHSFMFQGLDSSLTELKDLLKNFDTPSDAENRQKSSYFIYKVQSTTGDQIEEDLDNIAANFKSSGYKDEKILDVIEHIRYVKETNSLLLTGDPGAIEEVKKIIAEYDHPKKKGIDTSKFFMYKPRHISAKCIKKALSEVGENLKKADLADPNLLNAIDSAKYVESTNSLIFTGSPDALEKIQELVKDIDTPIDSFASIQKVGKTTFFLYKLKNARGNEIVSSIKTMTANLKKSGNVDKQFLSALQSMKYVKETNSLLFTGTEEGLKKVQELVGQLDLSSSPIGNGVPLGTSPNFYVYRPQSLSGPELEKIMVDFGENLKLSGLSDPGLYRAIDSMRYIDKTQSLIFTGDEKALAQVKDLVKMFDIPSNMIGGPQSGGPLDPTIQAIDNTSFLVYKLQFHKGDEIQGALRQIAKDLTLSNAPVNKNLLNSINSIQWLEVTNSLLCSGDQDTLARLKELIKNLDIPLKQVFIEMLVIETSLTNALQFGLEWGGNYKYRNKFGGSMFNTNPDTNFTAAQNPPSADSFITAVKDQVPPASITPVGKISPSAGFDLGVIGQVIKHNGDTFLTLGSLLTALQTDTETSVLMTPKIITQDGRTSSIFVGRNIPFFGSFINNSSGSTNVLQTTNIEYRDIGVNLTVTPVLGNSDVVTLDIALDRTQQLTDVSGSTINVSGTSASAPTTSKTTMQTTVHVPDKSFLVLSGFVDSTNVKSKAGIPCLGGLPIIGAAFSKANETSSNTNIVIFLRPHIITSVDDMRELTDSQEEFFRDQTGTPYLEHNFDEAMELIKSIDDE